MARPPSRAVMAQAFGPPESYALSPYDPGVPKSGEVQVAIKAAGISFVDVLTARGEYQFKPPLPFIPGSEYAGIVDAIGEGVNQFSIGDRVFGSSLGGTFCEMANFKASNINLMPAGMSFESAAVFPVNYMTAYHAIKDRGRAKAGETMLVLGAAGGTGYAAIQVGKQLGLKVIASASSAEKRAVAVEGGADIVVVSGAEDWRDQVKAANDGKAIDIIFDPVGGDATQLAFRTLGYDGRHLVIGFPAGIASIKTNLPLLKSASLIGVQLRHFAMEFPEQAAANKDTVFALAAKGAFHPKVAKTYPIEEFSAAMNAAASGASAGRIVLTMD